MSDMRETMREPTRLMNPTLVALGFATLAAFGLGCSIEEGVGLTTGSGGGGGGTGEGGTSHLSGRELFEQTVEPGLVNDAKCTNCHEKGGIADFLALPDRYTSIKVYKSVITDRPILWPVPEESVLYWYPDTPEHSPGTPYGADRADLKKAVLFWLEKEAKELPPIDPNTSAEIVPFTPVMGFNTIYLDPLGADFKSSAISFIAEEVGSPPSMLRITQLKVQPADSRGLRLVHPRFVVYPPGSTTGEPDPVDSLSDVDESFPKKDLNGNFTGVQTLGPGSLYLANWKSGSRLTLDFKEGKIEAFVLDAQGQVAVPCKDPMAFQSAVTALGLGGPQHCANECHGGGRIEARAAMNLEGLKVNDYNFACAIMRTRITPGDVDNSQIMQVTDPGQLQVVHMYKFDGDPSKYSAFKTGMTTWINNEAQ